MHTETAEEKSEEEEELGVTCADQALREGDKGPPRPPVLTKAETREMRRVRRLDYSWLLHGSNQS